MVRDRPTRKRRPGEPIEPSTRLAPGALVLHRRGRPAGELRLSSGVAYTLGRSAGADLCFDDDGVSRVHAHLKEEEGAWVLVDARSANGSYVAEGGGVHSDLGRARLFAAARRLAPGEPLVLGVGDVVFLGDAHAAVEATATATTPSLPDASGSARGDRYARELARAGRGRGPVLLLGASGTGKTWAARRIHDDSGRSGAFVALNAAALPHDPAQLRSTLLGHKKGAFTGATGDVPGAFRAAEHGTLFLDEVDSLAPPAQGFLLTLLEQSGDLVPLGGTQADAPGLLDVRVVAATKKPLAETALRHDLAFRLADGAIVEIPSLAERKEDIPALVRGLLEELRREDGAAASFSAGALGACVDAEWPGELRQLRGVVRLLAREALEDGRDTVEADEMRERIAAQARALGRPRTSVRGEASFEQKKPRQLTRDDVAAAVSEARGNLQHASRALGVARNTLVAKMDAFGIERPGKR
ncbi:MAG: sigma-54-dependent Fis family transcriptional regulator [Deltaproteobacteria bacterium]|nr:sigma-54-dependent Fis family transcriptional regulator [Deltaproteobacteria bacterium]